MSDNVVDIITRSVVEKLGTEIESRAQAVIKDVADRLEQEALRRIDAAVADIPQIAIRVAEQTQPIPVPGELVQDQDQDQDARVDARDRAWRTLVQGLIATVLLAVVPAFGAAITEPGFDLLTWDSWRAAAMAGGTAAVMAVTSYIQRIVQPPRGER